MNTASCYSSFKMEQIEWTELSPLLWGSGSGTCLGLLVQTLKGNALGSLHTSFPHTHPLLKKDMDVSSTSNTQMRIRFWKYIKTQRTASISLRDFHCSYGTPRHSAVWIVLFIWLVHTFKSLIFWSWMNFLRCLANWRARHEYALNPSPDLKKKT